MKTSIPYAQLAEFVESALGVADTKDVASIEITGGGITVVELRNDEQGSRYAVGDDVATVTTLIAIDRKEQ